ncbi:MAG: hypothetical protein LBF97_02010 [Elusimicrobiota bacterium]|jgi:hypothetical protein|nr:hypothetical protein [Elusimicrobiota bacterium]
MDKIDIFFKNCYGIKLLETSFDFTKNKSFIIYASNGSMKTSFAKTFKDFAEGKDSCDNIYPAKKADRKILKQNQKEVDKREIFVINSYDQTYRPSKIETLLINEQIKNEYDKIFNEIDEQKKIIIEKLKEQSGIKENPDRVMSFDIIFKNDNKAFFETLKSIEDGLKNFKAKFLASLIYVRIFNEKTKKLFEDSNFQERLQKYLNTYNKLIDESTFFKKGIFDHKNASDVVKNLKENGFFRADHKVFLNGKIEIKTEEELEKMIEAEKNKILENKELKKNFNDIERTLSTNKELRDFLHYIKANQIILENLNNVSLFKRNLWIAYLFEQKEIYKSLMNI